MADALLVAPASTRPAVAAIIMNLVIASPRALREPRRPIGVAFPGVLPAEVKSKSRNYRSRQEQLGSIYLSTSRSGRGQAILMFRAAVIVRSSTSERDIKRKITYFYLKAFLVIRVNLNILGYLLAGY
ncbi:MAG: hypothetical protein M5U07_27380 [Xanthobacteraceae bacterium]|nr:hypothetical protein [Xanthobacteraceae bacterium]